MRFTRTLHRNSVVFWLLTLSLGLRSLIAPGFMLDFNDDTPLGIGITLCSSLDDINAHTIFAGEHISHGTADAAHHDHGDENTLSEHNCGAWSPSTIYAQDFEFNNDHLLQLGSDQFHIDYIAPATRTSYRLQQQPRAPPVSSII